MLDFQTAKRQQLRHRKRQAAATVPHATHNQSRACRYRLRIPRQAEIDRWLPNHSGAESPLPRRPPRNVRPVNSLWRAISVHVRTRNL